MKTLVANKKELEEEIIEVKKQIGKERRKSAHIIN